MGDFRMLLFLKNRELRRDHHTNCKSLFSSIGGIDKQRAKQSLKTFFPFLGSVNNVVILGFTSCGLYLISLNGTTVRIHSLKLSLHHIRIGYVEQSLVVRSNQEINMNFYTLLEVLYLKRDPLKFFVSVTVPIDGIVVTERVWLGRLRLFENGRVVHTAVMPLSLRHNAVCSFGLHDDVAVIVNSGVTCHVFLSVHVDNSSSKPPLESINSAVWMYREASSLSMQRVQGCFGVEMFSGAAGGGWWASDFDSGTAGSSDTANTDTASSTESEGITVSASGSAANSGDTKLRSDSGGCKGSLNCAPLPILHHVSFDLEAFALEVLLRSHRSGEVRRGSLILELEHRVLGPCDSSLEYLAVVGVTYTHTLLGQMSSAFLCVLSPWTGSIGVLKVCNLTVLCTTDAAKFDLFRRGQATRREANQSTSWMCAAVDFYCAIVRKAYCALLGGGGGEEECREFHTLSNWDMVMEGASLQQLPHPFLPVTICHRDDTDEEED